MSAFHEFEKGRQALEALKRSQSNGDEEFEGGSPVSVRRR
jgi:hypothetical protein